MAGQKQSVKVGDLVVCHCANTAAWYWGKPGLVIYFDHWNKHHTFKGDPVVQYGNRTVRLTRSGLEVLHAANPLKSFDD
jgi:hypothetical protein